MLISLRSDHKEHLQLLTTQSDQVVGDFCKLASDFIQNGPNTKIYKTAARRLEVEVDAIQNCIYGLINLLLIAGHHKLNEADFRDSVLTLGFSNEQEAVLSQLYESNKIDINSFNEIGLNDPHYHNLQWRFEVQRYTVVNRTNAWLYPWLHMPQLIARRVGALKNSYGVLACMSTYLVKTVSNTLCKNLVISCAPIDIEQLASRSLLQQVTPLITMDLTLRSHKENSLEPEYKHMLLQTDPTNLLHLANELENALVESRSRHSRKIQMALNNLHH